MNSKIPLFVALLAACFVARAAAPSADAIKQLAEDYFAKRPSQSVHASLSLDEARRTQKEFVTH